MNNTFKIAFVDGRTSKDNTVVEFFVPGLELIKEMSGDIKFPKEGTPERKKFEDLGFIKYFESTLKPLIKEIYVDSQEMKFEEFWNMYLKLRTLDIHLAFVRRARTELDNFPLRNTAI